MIKQLIVHFEIFFFIFYVKILIKQVILTKTSEDYGFIINSNLQSVDLFKAKWVETIINYI